jgi:hypothetical protein
MNEIKQQIATYEFRLEYGLRLADYYRLVRDTAKTELIAKHRKSHLQSLAYWQGMYADWIQS